MLSSFEYVNRHVEVKLYVIKDVFLSTESPDPLNFTITNVTRRSVVLRWRVVFDGNSVIQKITLKYFENGSKPESGMTKNFTSNITSFTVKSLTPGKWYVFEITATNKIGTSNISFGEVMIKEDGKYLSLE